jgi:hypothetical protein
MATVEGGGPYSRIAAGRDDIVVIGRFVPSALQSEVIEAEIRAWLPMCCRRERISVRIPMGIAPHPDNLEWHQDGGGAVGTTHHMVVWASEQPTELRASTGERVLAQPFDLVWFDNTRAFHRQPACTDETRRWFAAVRCSGSLAVGSTHPPM